MAGTTNRSRCDTKFCGLNVPITHSGTISLASNIELNKSKIISDLNTAQKVLDEDHYGLAKVKERIIEYLAVQKRIEKLKGPILCLVGPPGV